MNSLSQASRRQFFKFAAIAGTSAALNVTIGKTKAIANSTRLQTASNDLTVRMGVVGLSFYRVVGGVMQNVLESLGHQVEITEGPHEEDWVSAFEQGVEAENGVIVPLWQPQYLNQAYEIRRLDDPLGVFPEPDRCSLVVTQNFGDRAPSKTLDTLNRISLGVDAVTEMDYLTNVEGLSPREAATQWMANNPEMVQSWMVSAS